VTRERTVLEARAPTIRAASWLVQPRTSTTNHASHSSGGNAASVARSTIASTCPPPDPRSAI
jgi:hypothetical protein